MDNFEEGMYSTSDSRIGAVLIRNGSLIGFVRVGSLLDRDSPHYMTWADITPSATFRRLNSPTLTEAAEAFIENRAPRWKN